MESDGKPPEDEARADATRTGEKREESAKPRGRPFEPGNQAGVGHGRPKKDFDLVVRCEELSPDIIEHYALKAKTAATGPEVEMGKVVLAYAYGKPRSRLEHSGPGGGPIQIAAASTTEQKRARLRQLARATAERVSAAPAELPAIADEDPAGEDAAPDGAVGS